MKFLGPVHILLYSSLLGAELYQTFVMTKVSHQALPRSAFTIYFCTQTVLLALTMATIPPAGPFTLVADKTAWISFSVAALTAVLNLLVFGPKTRQVMIERIHQGKLRPRNHDLNTLMLFLRSDSAKQILLETRDKTQGNDMAEPSPDMQKLNGMFSRQHAMSVSTRPCPN